MEESSLNNKKSKLLRKEVLFIAIGVVVIIVAVVMFILSSNSDKNGDNGNNGNGNNLVVDEGGPKANVNSGVVEDKMQDGLRFTNTSLVYEDNLSTLITTVENTTAQDIQVRIFDIYVKDAEGKTIVTLQGYVGGSIPTGKSRQIKSSVAMDLTEAVNIEYKIVN